MSTGVRVPPFVDLTGRRFGKLVAVEIVGRKNYKIVYLCHCDCGNDHEVVGPSLSGGKTRSCGQCGFGILCYPKGMGSTHPLYKIWSSMRERCNLPNSHAYQHYGDRGIKVCGRWDCRGGFTAWLEDVGERPDEHYPSGWPRYTLERIDNDAHYSCGHCEECVENGWAANCCWAVASDQLANQRPRIVMSHATAELIDTVRGDLTRDTWVEQACLAALDVAPS